MLPVLTTAEMAAADAAAPEPVEVLIERAGAAVASEALRMLGGAYGRRIVVLAGKGNNGADGRAAAVRLRRRGARVDVIDVVSAPGLIERADLVIDAAYGTGFRGEYDAPEVGRTPVLAVDIPSGVLGNTGEAPGRVLPATRTVTFAALKPGLLLEPGRSLAGDVVVADIGLTLPEVSTGVVERADVAAWLPRRPATAHKWNAAVLVVAGSPGMTGAARLAAASAQRTGAGMVRVGAPGVADPDQVRPTEATGLPLPSEGWAGAVTEAAGRFGAMVLGPGLGRSAATAADVVAVLAANDELPIVVDGDGLAALGAAGGEALRRRGTVTVLTPHDGEYELLTGHAPDPDRLDAARRLAAETGAIVLLKGPATVVADPDGRMCVVTAGDARLATAGTGDVLSGVIGALLAQGVAPLDAASGGAWLHGRAAALGPPLGLVAGDLVDLLPSALAEVTR